MVVMGLLITARPLAACRACVSWWPSGSWHSSASAVCRSWMRCGGQLGARPGRSISTITCCVSPCPRPPAKRAGGLGGRTREHAVQHRPAALDIPSRRALPGRQRHDRAHPPLLRGRHRADARARWPGRRCTRRRRAAPLRPVGAGTPAAASARCRLAPVVARVRRSAGERRALHAASDSRRRRRSREALGIAGEVARLGVLLADDPVDPAEAAAERRQARRMGRAAGTGGGSNRRPRARLHDQRRA